MEDKLIIGKTFVFDSAHFLPEHSGKCKELHGHTYALTIEITGKIKSNGMVLDYHRLAEVIENDILNYVDHKCLNDVLGKAPPTCENTVMWIYHRLRRTFDLHRIELHEGTGGYAVWQTK